MIPEKQKKHKTILLDASSAILLTKAGFHETLSKNYSVLMTGSVFNEITRNRLPGSCEYEKLLRKKLVTILPVHGSLIITGVDVSLNKLDEGERDTLISFLAGQGDFVVTDDGAAAKFCLNNSVPFVNSLLILRILHNFGRINHSTYESGFRFLLSIGRYSEKVIHFAQNCPDEQLLFFRPMNNTIFLKKR